MTNESDDRELLRRWATSRDEEAFSRLRRRYANLVFSVCLRETRDQTLAEDAAQAVYLLLAQKAAPLSRRSGPLAGWLFAAARLVGKNAMKQNARRARREVRGELADRALMEHADDGTHKIGDASREESYPAIDMRLNNALARLSGRDRDAVLLRFFDERSFAEIGSALGVAENAARMRVSRAVDKLRGHFAKAGVVVSPAVLDAFLAERGSVTAPQRLFQSPITAASPTTSISLTASGGVSSPFLKGTGILLMTTTYKSAFVATAAALGVIALLGAGGGAVQFAQRQNAGPARLTENARRAVLTPLVGEWSGELEYRDYQSEHLIKTPARAAITMAPGGDALSALVTYPRFRGRKETFTWSLSAQTGIWSYKDNDRSDENTVAGLDAFAATGQGSLSLTTRGVDGVRPSEIRTVISRVGDNLTLRREARPLGGATSKTPFAFRNQYTLRRSKSSPVTP